MYNNDASLFIEGGGRSDKSSGISPPLPVLPYVQQDL